MNGIVFYSAGGNSFAIRRLQEQGFTVADAPSPAVTHLLLGIPTPSGGEIQELLPQLPKTVTVIGGHLRQPWLKGYETLDLLQDEGYLAKNAAITADCAIQVARSHLPVVLEGCSVLILGCGRIGKCLAKQLKANGADVTVAVRKEKDLAMLQALGYRAVYFGSIPFSQYRLIFNTAPQPVMNEEQAAQCREDCIKIELASQPGIAGTDVVQARGLPGKLAAESAGLLIADTVMAHILSKEG